MSATLERILSEVDKLPQHEQCELTAFLNQRLESSVPCEDAGIDAAWDEELGHRVASVVSGAATLIPGEEFEGRMASFMADVKAGKSPSAL